MDEWEELREKLCSDEDVTEVLNRLERYVLAYKLSKKADKVHDDYVSKDIKSLGYWCTHLSELLSVCVETDRLFGEAQELYRLKNATYWQLCALI